MRKKGKIKALIIAATLCAVLLTVGIVSNASYSGPSYAGTEGSSWMSKVNGSLPLSQITIPGAHDAGTCKVQMSAFSQCQDKSISELLNCGYRYLDIRLGVSGNSLRFYHGSTSCMSPNGSGYLYLDSVLQDCYTFLQQNPTETILFVVKQEKGNDLANFQMILNNYVNANYSSWLLTNTIPTLDQARGKIVLCRRYSDAARLGVQAGVPLLWNDQGNKGNASVSYERYNSEGIDLWVQDRYKYGTSDKWSVFRTSLDTANIRGNGVMINFLSTTGSGWLGRPIKFANSLNATYLNESIAGRNQGWLVVDFGSSQLAQKVYSTNF